MRKFFLAVAAMVMLATSCTKDETALVGNESLVSFSVSSPELQTRYGEGSEATDLYYAFYEVKNDGKLSILSEISATGDAQTGKLEIETLESGKATINVPLVDGRQYAAIFWAQAPQAPYTIDWKDTQKMSYKDGVALTVNNEDYDAFYAYYPVSTEKTHKVTLTRPFAQINIATAEEDYENAKKAGFTAAETKVVVKGVCKSFDLVNGKVAADEQSELTFDWDDIAECDNANCTGKKAGYMNLAMNYVLVEGRRLVTVEMYVNDEDVKRTYTTVPVERNYRTYILGNLLTTNNEFDVETNPDWVEDPYYVWDGSEVKMPKVNANDNNIYEIEDASELAWLAAAVNGTLTEDYTRSTVAVNNFAGKTFKLVKDIYLGGKEWTPIGMGKNLSAGETFRGTFDGQDHTIYGLNVNQKDVAGLFGYVYAATIKNVIIDGATINSNHYAGGIVAWINNNTGNIQVPMVIDNCHVKNSTITSTPEQINGEWDNGDKVGGIVGYADFGTATYAPNQGAVISNCSVEETTIKAYRDFAGIAGYASYTTINGCTLTDVTLEWDNSHNYKNYADENAANKGNIIGRYEGLNTVDGKLYVASAKQLQAALDAATEGETIIYFGADIVAGVTEIQKLGRQVIIDGENHKYNGTIKVHSNSNYYDDAALTIKNVNFETSTASINFIEALENGAERYSQNITAENCTFTATGDAVNTAVGLQVKATRGVTVKNCKATNMHSLIQAQSCDTGDVKVLGCTINGKNGVAFKQVKSAIVESTTITAKEYGIRFDGNIDNYGITVKDNNITATQPLIVRKMTGANNTIALEGTNTLTTEAEYQIVITNGSDDEAYVKPTGTYTLTGADNYTLFPAAFPVASWDEFTAALAAGETDIKLTADITYASNYQLQKSVTLNLGGYSMTLPMINIHTKTTVKNGTINGKVYARKNSEIVFDNVKFSGAVADNLSTEGHLAIQGGCKSLYAKDCLFSPTSVSGSQTKPLSFEGGSTIMKFENCEFKSSPYKKQVYFNSLSATGSLDFTNCNFNNKTPNIMFAAAAPLANLTMSGTTKLSSVTLETNRAKTAITEADLAYLRTMIANNSFSSFRLFYAGGSSEYIR